MSLTDYFYYDETSPTCLRWRVDRPGITKAGAQAGGLPRRKNGKKDYSRVRYMGKYLAVSRVIWEIHNGRIPEKMVVDHVDGDKWNNRISNLEIKTQQFNCQNMGRRSDNSSGITGISVKKQIKGKYEYNYVFSYAGAGSRLMKAFSIDKLGFAEAMKQALEWRLSKICELNNEGNSYTDRHIEDLNKVLKELDEDSKYFG